MIDIERLWQRVRYMVTRGRLSLVDDAGQVQRVQLLVHTGWTQDGVPRVAEYGFQSVPPAGAEAVVASLSGDPTSAVVIATGHLTYRLTGLADGEVAISDNRGQKVYLSAAGIRIEGGSLPVQIDASAGVTINASAGLTVHGPTTFDGTVTANGHRIDESHKHGGVAVGAGLTGAVS